MVLDVMTNYQSIHDLRQKEGKIKRKKESHFKQTAGIYTRQMSTNTHRLMVGASIGDLLRRFTFMGQTVQALVGEAEAQLSKTLQY